MDPHHLRLTSSLRDLTGNRHSEVHGTQEAQHHHDLRPRLRPDCGRGLLPINEQCGKAFGTFGRTGGRREDGQRTGAGSATDANEATYRPRYEPGNAPGAG